MGLCSLLPLFLGVLPVIVESTVICDDIIVCHGYGAYCCVLDDGDEGCCWETFVYEFWWFWAIWVGVLMLVVGCCTRFLRRRYRNQRMATMVNSQYPTYGTVIATQSTTHSGHSGPMVYPTSVQSPHFPPNNPYAQPPPGYAATEPGSMMPPSYADAEKAKNEKPPAYNTA